jgi:hypothetical protein
MGFGVNLMIVDIPESLPVPYLFVPATAVPDWNKLQPGFLDKIFKFAYFHIHNVRAILFF